MRVGEGTDDEQHGEEEEEEDSRRVVGEVRSRERGTEEPGWSLSAPSFLGSLLFQLCQAAQSEISHFGSDFNVLYGVYSCPPPALRWSNGWRDAPDFPQKS